MREITHDYNGDHPYRDHPADQRMAMRWLTTGPTIKCWVYEKTAPTSRLGSSRAKSARPKYSLVVVLPPKVPA